MRIKIVILLLFIYQGVNAQYKKNRPLRPAIPINSLQLNIQIKEGRKFYSFFKKEKYSIKDNKTYSIWIYKEVKKRKYNITYNVEGNDISPSSTDIGQGKYTGFDEIGSFNKGYKNGFWKTKYKNKLVKTMNYNQGLLIGRYRVYNVKGDLLYKTTLGAKGTGKYKDYYYETGVLKEVGNYKNGKKEGQWLYYDKNGKETRRMHYKDGMLVK